MTNYSYIILATAISFFTVSPLQSAIASGRRLSLVERGLSRDNERYKLMKGERKKRSHSCNKQQKPNKSRPLVWYIIAEVLETNVSERTKRKLQPATNKLYKALGEEENMHLLLVDLQDSLGALMSNLTHERKKDNYSQDRENLSLLLKKITQIDLIITLPPTMYSCPTPHISSVEKKRSKTV